MTKIELLPPKVTVQPNIKLRLRVLAAVLLELTTICGVDIGDDLERGIIDRDVLREIIITFVDESGVGHGKVKFVINWEKFEVLARMEDDQPYRGLDFSKGYCSVLDPRLKRVLEMHVEKLREAFNIRHVVCSFRYREKYSANSQRYNATKGYMHHVTSKDIQMVKDTKFMNEIRAVFQGLDGVLDVIFEFN